MSNKRVFALAIFIYLFLATFTYHPDIKTIFYQTQFLSRGVINIYSFFAENRDLAYLGNFVYPPLAYFVFGILYVPVKIIAGSGFSQWLGMGSTAVGVTHIFRYLFAIKLPAFVFHLLTAFFLLKMVKSKIQQKTLLILWFFNPISIYVVAFMGQIDSLVVLLTVISLYSSKKKPMLSSFVLGLASAVKKYPLLLIPFLAYSVGEKWFKKIVYLLTGLITYGLFTVPFLKTPAFYSSTLISGLSQRIFELRIPIGFGEYILVIPALLLLLFLVFVYRGRNGRDRLLGFFFAVTFTISALTHFHPQWSLWFLPFLVGCLIGSLKHDSYKLAFGMMLIGWLGTILLFEDRFLSWGILSPIDPGILFLPSLSQFIESIVNPLLVQSVFHTIFIVCGLYLVWRVNVKK